MTGPSWTRPAPTPAHRPAATASGYDHWRAYHDVETLARADALRRTAAIRSAGVTIHLDVYPQADPGAPTVVVNHGSAGYCRLFVPLALALHDRGYAVVLPDQRGQGLSGGRRGDATVAEATQNVVDAARWARAQHGGPVVMLGASMGGILSYYAAAAGAAVEAVVCVNLVDLSGVDAWRFSRFPVLARAPRLASAVGRLMSTLSPVVRIRVPLAWIARVEKLMDAREPHAQAVWAADPVPPRRVSLRHLASLVTTPPAVPLRDNRVPVLVVNQARDEMVDPAATRCAYETLGGPTRYLEVPYGHWSLGSGMTDAVAAAADGWFREHVGDPPG